MSYFNAEFLDSEHSPAGPAPAGGGGPVPPYGAVQFGSILIQSYS